MHAASGTGRVRHWSMPIPAHCPAQSGSGRLGCTSSRATEETTIFVGSGASPFFPAPDPDLFGIEARGVFGKSVGCRCVAPGSGAVAMRRGTLLRSHLVETGESVRRPIRSSASTPGSDLPTPVPPPSWQAVAAGKATRSPRLFTGRKPPFFLVLMNLRCCIDGPLLSARRNGCRYTTTTAGLRSCDGTGRSIDTTDCCEV